MRVRFWGTRGSLAKPGPSTVRYGGNTSCVEVRADDGTLVVLDCGTGAHGLGQALLAEEHGPTRGHLLISHTHWDHIQGFPFFAPLFVPGSEWDVYGPGDVSATLADIFARQQDYHVFPVSLGQLAATIRFHDLTEGSFRVGGVDVTACYLNHPAVTLGYRLEAGSASVVYATDHEPHWTEVADGWLEPDSVHREDQRHVQFLSGAELVIHDAQYRLSEMETKRGWGHTPAERAVDYCVAASVKNLALFHHDPLRDDPEVDRLVMRCSLRAAASRLHIFGAAEGNDFTIAESPRTGSGAAEDPLRLVEAVHPPEAAEPATILVVDDDRDIVNYIVEVLREDGFTLLTAHNGGAALRQAREHRPDLILLDCMMPGMDGLEACRQLRADADPTVSQLPVLMITCLGGSKDLARGFEAGASDYMVKPFTPAYIRSRVHDWLFRQGRVAEEVVPGSRKLEAGGWGSPEASRAAR